MGLKMKVVILAGGFGTRLAEETSTRPKPMIDIGGKPLLWHIMKLYSHHGFNDFVICLGYMSYYIKEYFSNYALHTSDVTYDFVAGTQKHYNNQTEPWSVSLIDTGVDTMTGGRLKRVREHLGNETFMLTYGDGVSDVNIKELVAFHRQHGKAATVTAVQPPGRFGALEMDESGHVGAFREKPQDEVGWINGGFFVLEPSVIDLIESDATSWEREPLEALANQGDLVARRHRGFWQPVDTLRDKRLLEERWGSGKAPWKVWA
jgi:glucose-1-phosphate cytidylyltransferase